MRVALAILIAFAAIASHPRASVAGETRPQLTRCCARGMTAEAPRPDRDARVERACCCVLQAATAHPTVDAGELGERTPLVPAIVAIAIAPAPRPVIVTRAIRPEARALAPPRTLFALHVARLL